MNICRYIDYIDDPADTYEEYLQKAKQYRFRCVFANPKCKHIADDYLCNTGILIAGAIDFPLGILTLEEKMKVFWHYADMGFQEIDYVLCQKHVEERQYEKIYEEMRKVHEFCENAGIREKVIVEMCKLDAYPQAKEEICKIALQIRPSFLKTSTGRSWKGADLEDVRLMKKILGDTVAIKAAGGIKTYLQANAFLEAGAAVLGASSAIAIVNEEKAAERAKRGEIG